MVAETRNYTKRLPREERREQILHATLTLISRDGWSSLRINRVADEAGIAKSVVYAIFGSMEGLQVEVMTREHQRAFALADQAIGSARSEADPVAAISAGLETFLKGVADQPMTWRLVLVPAESTPQKVQTAILNGRERWREEIESLVADLIGDQEPDIELVSHVIRGNVEYLARTIIENPVDFTPERISALGRRVAGALLSRDQT